MPTSFLDLIILSSIVSIQDGMGVATPALAEAAASHKNYLPDKFHDGGQSCSIRVSR